MKRNAIIRIVLWSIALVVLLAILFLVVYGTTTHTVYEIPAETAVAIPLVTSPADITSGNAITTSDLNVRRSPDTCAEVVALAEKGTVLNILRQEQIGSIRWGYIGAPAKGWVAMDYVKLLEPVGESAAATEVPDLPEDSAHNAVTTAIVNLRTAPNSDSAIAGTLQKDDALVIARQELVNNIAWGYVSAPITGWIQMEYVKLLEPVAEEHTDVLATIPPETEITGYGVSLDASNIHDMQIEWAAGTISIQPMDIHEIRIQEYGPHQDKKPMVWNVRNDKLYIQYSEKMGHSFGMGLTFGKEEYKDLVIQVPLDWQCDSMEIDAAAASLEISGLTIREMEFNGASGTCVFDQCIVEKLDLDTASGDVRFSGSLQQLDCDAASANIVLELTNVPGSIDLDTASGDLDVTLPGYAGFQVTLESLSGRFESDFDAVRRNGTYIWGDGKCRIDVAAMSGDVIVRKGA